MNKNPSWSGSRTQKYIVRHSHTVFSLVILIMWLLRKKTGEKYCYDIQYIFGLHEDFFLYTRKRFSGKPIFFTPQLLLDKLWLHQGRIYPISISKKGKKSRLFFSWRTIAEDERYITKRYYNKCIKFPVRHFLVEFLID